MKFRLLSFFILLFYSIVSLAQTANLLEGCVPLEVKFNAPASSTMYFWDFKDGVTSNRRDPTNIFNRPGNYSVTFQETPAGPVLGTILIKVYEVPILQINRSAGCAPFNMQFQNMTAMDTNSIKVKSYTWIFGDGKTSTGVSHPSHIYQNPGLYTVSFSLQSVLPSCSKTAVFQNAVEVFSPPTASFTTNPNRTTFCADSVEVTFQSTSTGVKPSVLQWKFGNGDSSYSASPAKQRYFVGEYLPTLSVFFRDFPSCSSSLSKKIIVFPTIKPSINLLKDTVCLRIPTLLTTSTQGRYSWSISPSIFIPTPRNDSIHVVFNRATHYSVTLTVTSEDSICSATTEKKLLVDSVSANIFSNSTFTCQPTATIDYTGSSNRSNVSYLWKFLTKTDSSQHVSVTYNSIASRYRYAINDAELFPVTLTVKDTLTGCTATVSKTDTLWRPNALFTVDQNKGCFPLTVNFIDKSTSSNKKRIVKWNWLFGDGTDTTLTAPITIGHVYKNVGQYDAFLLVETADGCKDTSYNTTIRVGQDVTSSIDFTTNKTSVCPGEPLVFTARVPSSPSLDFYHFGSAGNRIVKCQNESQVSWQYLDTTGLQDVTMYAAHNGCLSAIKKEKFIYVKGAIARIDYDYHCNDPFVYRFKSKSAGAQQLSWAFGDGQTSTEKNAVKTYTKTGDYTVILTATTDTSGCAPDQDSITVAVRNVKAAITFDSSLCLDVPRMFSAANSTDVEASCYSGYEWQFPTLDRRTFATEKDTASFRFPKKGAHTILLIVKDKNGCKDTTSALVKVFDMDVKASADKYLICPPNAIQFTDSSRGDTTLTQWAWSFDDNTTLSKERHPYHSFLSPTIDSLYSVKLTVTDTLGCFETIFIPIKQYRPFSKIQLSDSTLCERDSLVISATDFTKAGSRLTFSWNIGKGIRSEQQANKVRFDSAGNHSVHLYYQEISSQCADSAKLILPVQGYPKAKFITSVDTVSLLCAPRNIYFRDISETKHPLTHYWNFSNGAIATVAEHSLTFPKGTFNVKHRVGTTFGCTDSVQRSFRVLSPEGSFDITPTNAICKGDAVQFVLKDTVDVANFTWAFGDGTIAHNVSPIVHHYTFHPPSGNTEARLILTGQEGCQFSPEQKKIEIHQVVASFIRESGVDTSICMSENPFHFTNTSKDYDNYKWDFGDGTSSSDRNPVHFYAQPGAYQVTLTISDNETKCKDTLVRKALVYANPQLQAVGDTACPQQGVSPKVLDPSPTSTYFWYTNAGTFASEGPAPVLLSKGNAFYQVIETNEANCKDTAEVNTLVLDPINLHSFDTTLVLGDSVALPVEKSSFYSFQWNTVEGLSCSNCNYPVAKPLESTNYVLKVTDIRGCAVPEFAYNITIREETFIKLPTFFTPNGDGNNDIVYVNGWGIKSLEEFLIFNRWGRLVFNTNKIEEGWDGKVEGILQNTDVYVFKVKAINWKDKPLYSEGFINLIR